MLTCGELELVRFGEKISEEKIDEKGRDHAEPRDDDRNDDRRKSHRSRTPAVPVRDATADAHNPTVPLSPLYVPHIQPPPVSRY